VLIVADDPEKKEELINGDLMRSKCIRCGYSTPVLYSLLYQDIARDFVVWLWLSPADPNTADEMIFMRDYQFRIVRSENELREKILIFDNGLDDRVLEICKFLLRKKPTRDRPKLEGDLFFKELRPWPEWGQAIVFELSSVPEELMLPRKTYNEMEACMLRKLPALEEVAKKWLHIDSKFAQSMVRKYG